MVERIFPADIKVLDSVIAFLEEELEKAECSPKFMMTFAVALEELFVNVAHYAYPDAPGTVAIGIDTEGDSIVLRLVDNGIPFDPVAKTDPDVTLSAEERKIGGLGIFMVKKSMDSMNYVRQDGKNILTISKRK